MNGRATERRNDVRVLFTSIPVTSHILNMVPLAWAMQSAGHDVRFAVRPEATATVAGTGLQPLAVGRPLDMGAFMERESVIAGLGFDISEDPATLDAERTLGILTWYTTVFLQNVNDETFVDDLVDAARAWRPGLVVWDALSYAGPVAARACGADHARLLFGLDLLARMRHRFQEQRRGLPPEARDDVLAEWLDVHLRRHGSAFTEADATGDWTVDPMPPPLALDSGLPAGLPRIAMRQTPYNGPSQVPRWLREPPSGRPRICLTLGLSLREMWDAAGLSVGDLLAAVADLDVDVVTTLPPDDEARHALPSNVRAVDFVPLTALLPSCAAIVHHGGAGTLHSAVAHGVPQLIVPDAVWDPRLLGERLADLGAGALVTPDRLTPERLRRELLRLLEDPSVPAAAARLSRSALTSPGPDSVARVLTSRRHSRK
ncbi:activator-dependent family glycosyltransferase [Streptomyces sp. NPDC050147]|uniref:activator-dependent family glycosyltransferase n=1 Tax=Streptomyces sp. NPDC050147 TaxID=3155513 RepID=UPI003425149D